VITAAALQYPCRDLAAHTVHYLLRLEGESGVEPTGSTDDDPVIIAIKAIRYHRICGEFSLAGWTA
jgi:hypothetical protein